MSDTTTTAPPMSRWAAREYMRDILFTHGKTSLRTRAHNYYRLNIPGGAVAAFNAALLDALRDARLAAVAEADELIIGAQSGTLSYDDALDEAREAMQFVAYVDMRTARPVLNYPVRDSPNSLTQ